MGGDQLALVPSAAAPVVRATAELSPCGTYRYALTRAWGEGPRWLYVMLNPSTADADVDDPTIRRCVGFARAHGAGSIEVVNLFAWRATKPGELARVIATGEDAVGPRADALIDAALVRAHMVVAAWGATHVRWAVSTMYAAARRASDVLQRLRRASDVHVFGLASDEPRHPLYLPATASPWRWFRRITEAPDAR